jgi:DNA-binding GntR family transcriptional regulator
MPGSNSGVRWKSRIRLVDEVVEELRERIYAGELAPGVPLRQEELAERLQISRTPLREALRILERDGFLVASPGRGLQVLAADLETLIAAYELREVYEGLAARLAASNATPDDMTKLREAISLQEMARRPWAPSKYTSANVRFHVAIVHAHL